MLVKFFIRVTLTIYGIKISCLTKINYGVILIDIPKALIGTRRLFDGLRERLFGEKTRRIFVVTALERP